MTVFPHLAHVQAAVYLKVGNISTAAGTASLIAGNSMNWSAVGSCILFILAAGSYIIGGYANWLHIKESKKQKKNGKH